MLQTLPLPAKIEAGILSTSMLTIPYRTRSERRSRMAIKKSTIERLESLFIPEPNSGCWLWMGDVTAAGYGRVGIEGNRLYVHRVSHEIFKGPIPATFDVDHLCRNRLCCNPQHLEAVSHRENIRRGLKGKLTTHCPQGHEYSLENTYFRKNSEARVCMVCARSKDKLRAPRNRRCP